MSKSEQEIALALDGRGVDLPERCQSCPKIGALAAQVSLAQSNIDFLTTASDEKVLIANMRSQLTLQGREHYGDMITDEQLEDWVDRNVGCHLSSSKYTEFLKDTAQLLTEEDRTLEQALASIERAASECPLTGCDDHLKA